MFLLGSRRKLTALALCKSIESAIQWFQIHHRITFATIQNPAVYLSGARVSFFSTLVPRLLCLSGRAKLKTRYTFYLLAQYYWHSKLLKRWSKGNNERNIEKVLFVNVMIPGFCCMELKLIPANRYFC